MAEAREKKPRLIHELSSEYHLHPPESPGMAPVPCAEENVKEDGDLVAGPQPKKMKLSEDQHSFESENGTNVVDPLELQRHGIQIDSKTSRAHRSSTETLRAFYVKLLEQAGSCESKLSSFSWWNCYADLTADQAKVLSGMDGVKFAKVLRQYSAAPFFGGARLRL